MKHRNNGHVPSTPAVVPVRCDVRGFENITVHFRLDNGEYLQQRYRDESGHIKRLNEEEWLKFASLLLVKFDGWDIVDTDGRPVPVPEPSDPNTYYTLFVSREAAPLFEWALKIGYRRATALALAFRSDAAAS